MSRRVLSNACFTPLILLLAGCASEPLAPNPGLKESFHTEISANGSKRFTYALEMAAPLMRGPYTESPSMRSGMIRQQAPAGGSAGRGNRMDFDYAMELKLKESGFCRDGYFVIDRVVSQLGGEVRGECRDPASR
ncbi:hypothetical protein M0G74_13960 [Microbulbifer sp. CAU 1566]|uniref:hypothetical protein n=1 Tax=Microbulbifer sp. CAU 1566 TaxID=2933269 RepID=UPI002004B67A|nr:hypothetical protein [Microbulbifer sp. CAU 1566]MCK7598381.1 hypothetical protein [Microbulbifer sp. CAU 1566]